MVDYVMEHTQFDRHHCYKKIESIEKYQDGEFEYEFVRNWIWVLQIWNSFPCFLLESQNKKESEN